MLQDELLQNLSYSAQIYAKNNLFSCCHSCYCPDGTAYCVNVTKTRVTIVFRGTDSKSEWASNFMFLKKVLPYGNTYSKIRVHSGFILAYKQPCVRDKIHSLIPRGITQIVITGHSRGAALAVLCAVDLQYNFPKNNIKVYLFGCPRIGNAAFARSYNRRVFDTLRIENGNDIVTKLPPAIFGFRHVGTRVGVGATRLPLAFSLHAHLPQSYNKSIIDRMFT